MTDEFISGSAEAVAIVGMSGRFPGAADVGAFWRNLRDGVESISTFTDAELAESGVDADLASRPEYVRWAGVLEDVERFDARFFGFSPREAELLDPQQRLFLEESWKALEDAGIDPGRPPGRVGVFAGAGMAAYLLDHVYPRRDLLDAAGSYQAAVSNDKDFLATRVSYKLDLRGPSLSVQTACSTSLVAVCLACQSLMNGECDAALAGGVSLRLPQRAGYLHVEEGILSPDGHCRAFDAEARGTVPGSGVGVVVLKRLSDALRDGDAVRAVIRGWALNNDGGGKAGFTAPRAEGQAEVIQEALALAEVEPATVSYLEAHGTGTRLGDPIEIAALRKAFGGVEGEVLLGSVKTNIGHLDSAAGIAGLIKTVLALQHRQIPPTLHFTQPSPEIDFGPFRVPDRLTEWTPDGPRRAGVSSFGIGGTNAHVVLEEAPSSILPRSAGEDASVLLVLSAKTSTALEVVTSNLVAHLEAGLLTPDPSPIALPTTRERGAPSQDPEVSPLSRLGGSAMGEGGKGGEELADVAYTLQAGRQPMEVRRAVVARNLADAAAALSAEDSRRVWTAQPEPGFRPVAFLFPGQGAQHARMAAELYESGRWPVFNDQLNRCAEILQPHLGLDLRDELFAPESRLEQTALAQPALFAVEWSLARLWMDWGLQPETMLGHSVGEFVAACLAGVFSLEDALALVAARGRLVQETLPGAMLSVPLSEEALASWLEDGPSLVDLAAVNGPSLCAVSGSLEAIERLERRLREAGHESRRLHTSHAFHSALIEPAIGPFRDLVAAVERRPPSIPFLSNVTGGWITAAEAVDPDYWARHLRQPVRFGPAVAALLEEPRLLLLEVGPGTTLSTLVRRGGEARDRVFPSLPHPQDTEGDVRTLLEGVGRLWLAGVPLRATDSGRKVPLPTYPFERERYWLERVERAGISKGESAPQVSGKRSDPSEWSYLPTWKRTLPSAALPRIEGEGPWLIVGDGERLAEVLRGRGRPVSLHMENEELVRHVIFLGDAAGLVSLARNLGRQIHETVHIAVVVRGLYEVTGGEGSGLHGEIAGLAKVIPQEYPNLRCRLIDADQSQALVVELEVKDAPPVVALRGGHRWEQIFEPLPLPRAEGTALRPDGHYVITGGLGRFGQMVGNRLESLGAKVTLLDIQSGTDVADRESVTRAMREAVTAKGRIDGLFHAAGAPSDDYRTLSELGAADLERHLRPKVQGAMVLRETLRNLGETPAFCLATSSLAAVLGGVSLGAHAAADAALDALLGAWGAPWVSVNWEVWQSIGAGELGGLIGQQQNALMMTPEEVVDSLDRVLSLRGQPRLAVATGDLQARLAQWTDVLHSGSLPVHARPESGVPYRAPADPAEASIAAIWQELLGIDRIGADDDFFLLGGNSLAGLQILSRMRAEFDVELPLKAFFEARTVAGMAEEVRREREKAELEKRRLEEILAEIEALSLDEVQAQLAEEPS
ncbi:MAG TPA: beta-ketoacyl synthase N-terminal-like domain-containing protein [Thermoanaerobaculia bacterium]|nr:beta-ketoacyl synthase N-terminal-like domain-containing protein [Thermoanaerobaculia bacterium]